MEKGTSSMQPLANLGKRGEKGIEDIEVIVEFSTMSSEIKRKTIEKIKELMGK